MTPPWRAAPWLPCASPGRCSSPHAVRGGLSRDGVRREAENICSTALPCGSSGPLVYSTGTSCERTVCQVSQRTRFRCHLIRPHYLSPPAGPAGEPTPPALKELGVRLSLPSDPSSSGVNSTCPSNPTSHNDRAAQPLPPTPDTCPEGLGPSQGEALGWPSGSSRHRPSPGIRVSAEIQPLSRRQAKRHVTQMLLLPGPCGARLRRPSTGSPAQA